MLLGEGNITMDSLSIVKYGKYVEVNLAVVENTLTAVGKIY